LALLGLPVPGWPGAPADEDQTLEAWDRLLQATEPLAKKLVQSRSPDEEHYLRALSERVDRQSAPRALFRPGPAVSNAISFDRFPLMVVQFKLAPSAVIPFHDHPDYNSVLRVVSGRIRVHSFDAIRTGTVSPPIREFWVRETRDEILEAGQLSTLARTRDNIHAISAGPQGARYLDVFTLFRPGANSRYLDIAQRPVDAKRRIYQAKWSV
jgi:hypothetical protein